MVEFTKAVANWESGDRDSVAFFDSLVAQKFTDKKEWIEGYQEWAAKLSHDAGLLAKKEPRWKKKWSEAEINDELGRLKALRGQLQTSGRASFMVSSWELWLEGMKARQTRPDWQG